MKWGWTGHIARAPHGRWTKNTEEWRSRADKRNRGRSPTRLNNDVKRIVGNWMMTAQNRVTRRNLEKAYYGQ